MKNIFRLALLAAVAAFGFWLCTILFPSPEKVIRSRLADLARTATFGAQDSAIARALKAQRLANFFSADAQLTFDTPGMGQHTLSGREEIRENATAAFQSIPTLRVEFLDANIRLDAGRHDAEVGLTAKVTFGDTKDFGVQEMRFLFRKIDGQWLIVRIETVQTLS